ncbi:unnamed protein product [Owenia fusiformis]|uniref:Uncharacterized protein n=1 Tax=Owenia fusiformis TaxID=6347 RepID=A0A8J1UL18_OWEFU|nr:unnamed protein product [Owenia fusiformis]
MKYTESSNKVTLKSPASKHSKVQKRPSKPCYNTVNDGKSADNNNKFDSEDEDTIVDEAIGTDMEPVVKARRRSRKSEKLNYKCPQCPAVFHNRDEVYNHRAQDHEMYGCGLCKKIYETKELLNVHNHLHSSDNPYITMTTKGEKQYKCDICGEQFRTSTNFFKHMQLSHNLHKPLRCPYCSTSCKYFSQFSKHMDVHTGEKNHSCPNCGMKFNNKYSMLRHRRIHTGEKLHLCDICGKSFKDRQRLKEHRFVHGDMPKFDCDQCGQKFVSPIYLQRHRKSHKKLYECEKCGKRFGRLSHLKSHQRTHDGIKPYACDICGKMYSDPRPLRTHLIKLHDIEQDKIPTSRDCRVDIRLKDPKPVVETLVITEHEITELLQNGNIVSLQSNASNIDICP